MAQPPTIDCNESVDPARVASFVIGNFIPVRVHVKRQADEYNKRLSAKYNAAWPARPR